MNCPSHVTGVLGGTLLLAEAASECLLAPDAACLAAGALYLHTYLYIYIHIHMYIHIYI